MEILPLVPAPPVVVLPDGELVGAGAEDEGEGATAVEGLSEQVGAASASGRADKRESAIASMMEQGKGRGKKIVKEEWRERGSHVSSLLYWAVSLFGSGSTCQCLLWAK